MKRYAASLGLFAFIASLSLAFLGDESLSRVFKSAVFWGLGFAVLGAGLGRSVDVMLRESERTDPGEEVACGVDEGAEPSTTEETVDDRSGREPVASGAPDA